MSTGDGYLDALSRLASVDWNDGISVRAIADAIGELGREAMAASGDDEEQRFAILVALHSATLSIISHGLARLDELEQRLVALESAA